MVSANLLADLVKNNPDLFRQVGVEPVQGPQTIEVTSLGPGQATAVAVPAPSSAPASFTGFIPAQPGEAPPGPGPLPGPPPFVPSFQPVQARPAPTPAPSPTGQFIYNQYRRPAPPRMMFEGLPSLLERFRMQPSAQQQQYPMPPRFRFAEGGEAVASQPSPISGIKNILRRIQETQNVQDALPREAATVASPQLGIKNMIRRIQAAQNPDAIAPPSEPSIRSPIAGIKGLLSKIRQRALEQNQEPASTPRPKMEDFLPQARFSFDASTAPLLPLQQVMYTQPTYRSYTSPRPNPVVMPQGSDALSMFLKNRRML